MFQTSPAFNLKVVLKETGLAADTLRAWERRYGLPMPQRTEGGHRMYSERDIEIVKWLKAQIESGMSISRAVDRFNDLSASGADPLTVVSPGVASAAASVLPSASTLASLRSQWVRACSEFDEASGEQILNQAFSLFSVEDVCLEVIQKGLSEIGDLWFENRLSVQQEHFASGLAMRRLDALLSAAPAPTKRGAILVGCPADEWHTFPSLLVALLLRRRGYRVIHLGANVPTERLTESVNDTKAELVVLVAQQLVSAAALQKTAQALAVHGIHIAFGGRIFNLRPGLQEYIPGVFLGHEMRAVVGEIEKTLQAKGVPAASRSASRSHLAALQSFTARRAGIESTFKEMLPPLAISPEDIDTGLHFLGDHITAALQLGDMSHVSAEIDWLQKHLSLHASQPRQLIRFMELYARAVEKNINGQGKPIFAWLDSENQKLKAS